jgi:RNA polymerase sigma factor (sigma-70 family)
MAIAVKTGISYATGERWDMGETDQATDFEGFVRRHGGPLVRSLTLIALDREVAADAAQEAFIQLHVHWARICAYEDPAAWLYRIAVNRCRDYRRTLARASRLFERLSAAPSTEVVVEEWTPDSGVLGALHRLPSRQRAAAVLYYQADFSVAEIARVMHISEGAVSSHLHKAREALRQILEAE